MTGPSPEDLMRADGADVAGLVQAIAAEPDRHIAVPGTMNFRDAGGYPVAGGGSIRWRQLLRSDALHALEPAAAELLGQLGLRTVLDLRTAYEAEAAPSALDGLADGGTLTVHISLIGEDMTGLPLELSEIYDYIVDRQGAAIGSAVRTLARPGGLPALVHCTAGKDRTGIVVAFTLAAIGVPDHVIAADYALTSLYLYPGHAAMVMKMQESTGLAEGMTAALLASPPELIVRALDRARAKTGSIEGYLASYGVTTQDLTMLRSALVTGILPENDGG